MIRLKDIAERAGVSVMTVSKALREEKDVSDATRARIRALAREMGYVPNSMAQSLRTRTSRLFGLLIPSTTDPIFARVVLAIEERAHELGSGLLLAHSLNSPAREEACITSLLSRHVDALFIAPVYRIDPEARIYQLLQTRGTPAVLLGPPAPFCGQFPAVHVDDLLASHAVTQHLLQLGHKRIAFLAGPLAAPSSQHRFEGYRRALREAGLDIDDRLVFRAGGTIDQGTAVAAQFINESCDATAIQAADDLVAIGCANTLLDRGVRIPHDVSVAGFGNILASQFFRVPLTTVRQPKFRLGTAAVEMMIELLRGQRVESRRLPGELVVRASTAPPKACAAA